MGQKKGFFERLVGKEEEVEEKPETADEFIKKKVVYGKNCGPEGCKLIMVSMQGAAEPHYFWMLRFLRNTTTFGLGMFFERVEKIKDVYTAAEASSLWGSQEQRKGLQQDKVSQYMATIGKLIKDMFQVVRELRIIDERLAYYDGYNKYSRNPAGNEKYQSAAVALKGTWIDLVEGATKNPASVYGLASQVGFATLPDLFFTVHPKSQADVEREVKKLKGKGINRKVREVLGRKLVQFIIWKEKTEREIRTRKNFILKYLRMHFNNIKLYINWVKPYLRAIKQLQSRSSELNPDVSAAFETSQIELELLAVGKEYILTTEEGYEETFPFTKFKPCILVKFNHVTLPQMAFQKEYQRGPVHAGRTEITIFPCVLTEDEINHYKALRDKESFEEIEDLVPSLEDSLASIGEELTNYLEEAGETVEKKEEGKKEEPVSLGGIFSPFGALFKSGDAFKGGKKKGSLNSKEAVEKREAAKVAGTYVYMLYDVFKKTHGMLSP